MQRVSKTRGRGILFQFAETGKCKPCPAIPKTSTAKKVFFSSYANNNAHAPITPPNVKDKSKFTLTQEDVPYKTGKHRSNALQLLMENTDVIEVEGEMAVCDGGGGSLGHPLEYISLERGPGYVGVCIYCGLRFTQKKKM